MVSPALDVRPPKLPHALYVAAALALCVLGAYVALGGDRWLGGAVLGIGLMGLVAVVPLLLPGAEGLRIAPDGLGVTLYFRERLIPWDEIEHFTPDPSRRGGVLFRLTPHGRARLRARHPLLARASEDVAPLPSRYGRDTSALVDRLNDARARYAPADVGAADAPQALA